MNVPGCTRVGFADLTDYAAGELSDADAAAIEDHLFSCAECGAHAADLDALVRAIRRTVRSAEVGGFVTDAVLNRLGLQPGGDGEGVHGHAARQRRRHRADDESGWAERRLDTTYFS